jgi:hypothetical protein
MNMNMPSFAGKVSPTATNMIRMDHTHVMATFHQYETDSSPRTRQSLANTICLALEIHAQIEEEIFYPACEGKVDEDLLKESYVEHDGAKVLIAEIEANSEAGDAFFDAKVKVLQEQIEHHVEEEEKRMEGLFSQARHAGLDMEALGAQLARRKAELIETYQANGVPKPELRTMSEAQV